MSKTGYLSDDGLVALALCSAFALGRGEPAPLTLSEWNQLARRIHESALRRPRALAGISASQLSTALTLPPKFASRIVKSLGRLSEIRCELEALDSRGIWAVTRLDEKYPQQLRRALKHHAPVVMFGAGDIRSSQAGGLAVVGSRNVDEAGAAGARELGGAAARGGLVLISGCARGTDRLAMEGAIVAGGRSVGVLAESLEGMLRKREVQELVRESQLILLTQELPDTPFSVPIALARNRLIYALAEFAVVVSSDYRTGGTWAGATAALKSGWCPVFARVGSAVPEGNKRLVEAGALPFTPEALAAPSGLRSWLQSHASFKGEHPDLFSAERNTLRPQKSEPRFRV
jgi:predicted Rossmann fold nucleotide-binding protein DprA/Smf involved in DNA uptake